MHNWFFCALCHFAFSYMRNCCALSLYGPDYTWIWSCIFSKPLQVVSFLKCRHCIPGWLFFAFVVHLYPSQQEHNLFLFRGAGVISSQGCRVLVKTNVQLFVLHFNYAAIRWKSHLSCSGPVLPLCEDLGGQFFSTVVVMKMTVWVDLNWHGFVGCVQRVHL